MNLQERQPRYQGIFADIPRSDFPTAQSGLPVFYRQIRRYPADVDPEDAQDEYYHALRRRRIEGKRRLKRLLQDNTPKTSAQINNDPSRSETLPHTSKAIEGEVITATPEALAGIPSINRNSRTRVRLAAQRAEEVLSQTREERLATEEKNKKRPWLQRQFQKGVGKWVIKPAFEALPIPILLGYGPGDVLNIAEGIAGKNLFTGEELDRIDRGIHIAAGLIPVVPATYIAEPAKRMRRHVEDALHARRQGDVGRQVHHGREALRTVRSLLKRRKI